MKITPLIHISGIRRLVIKRKTRSTAPDYDITRIINRVDNENWIEEKTGRHYTSHQISRMIRSFTVCSFIFLSGPKYEIWFKDGSLNVKRLYRQDGYR